ncbi:MAG: hypothetical protein LUD18_04505, partial [Lachnospiraceae bacterium]|nr:hypothetical protein [Lachnospiraceae bacterium]
FRIFSRLSHCSVIKVPFVSLLLAHFSGATLIGYHIFSCLSTTFFNFFQFFLFHLSDKVETGEGGI